tara:strand:- start:453 stop:1112 length:660 start_codon:yes stop_codon:yes gene_type:complete
MIEATYIDHMGTDLTVVNAARVSFGKQSEMDTSDVWGPPKLKDKDAKLIRYLAKHKHISPFGHCFASFHVKAPVFVARQLVKHKFLRWNEVSKRYVDSEPELYVPKSWRGRSEDKKQGSTGEWYDDDLDSLLESCHKVCLHDYKELLDKGVCPEQARMVLPQSMMTEWYWSGSLDAFADMCNLRCKPDTQYETQVVAGHIDTEMAKLFPVSWEALREND